MNSRFRGTTGSVLLLDKFLLKCKLGSMNSRFRGTTGSVLLLDKFLDVYQSQGPRSNFWIEGAE